MLRTAVTAILIAISFMPVSASVESVIDEQLEASGAYELRDALPSDTKNRLDDAGIEIGAEGIGSIDMEDWSDCVSDLAAECSRAPLGTCLTAVSMVMICALANTVAEKSSGLSDSFDTVATAAVVLSVCVPAASFMDSAAESMAAVSGFSSVLVPVLAGLAAASGHASAASAYSAFTLAMIEFIDILVPAVVIPVLRIMLAVAAVSPFARSSSVDALVSSISKNAKWMLGLMGVLLSGTLGLSSVAASAADNAAVRATKFVISGAVPVVGGAISDAMGTIANCISIVRTSAGAFGIVAGIFIVLPTVVTAVLWLVGLNCAAWVAEAFGAPRPASAMKNMAGIISLLLGLTALVVVLTTCTAAVLMNLRSR